MTRWYMSCSILCVLLLCGGCDGDTNAPESDTDPQNVETDGPTTPFPNGTEGAPLCLTADSTPWVASGPERKSLVMTLSNCSDQPLELLSISISEASADGIFIVELSPAGDFPMNVPPGGGVNFQISAQWATCPASETAMLRVMTDQELVPSLFPLALALTEGTDC